MSVSITEIVEELRATGKPRKSVGSKYKSLFVTVRGASVRWEFKHRVGDKIKSEWLGPAVGDGALGVRDAFNEGMRRKLNGSAAPITLPAVRSPSITPAIESQPITGKTFADAVKEWVPAAFAKSRNGPDGKQAKQALSALLKLTTLAPMDIAVISPPEVKAALDVLIDKGHETQAERVRSDMARVFRWAMIPGRTILPDGTRLAWRTAPNPADLNALSVEHYNVPEDGDGHPRVGEKDLPKLTRALLVKDDIAARALLLTLLAACRTGDTEKFTWGQIKGDVWTIPIAKNGKPLDVPILPAMRKLIGDRGTAAADVRVFLMPKNAMLDVLDGFGFKDPDSSRKSTVHGLRASFRTWATDTGQDRGLAERALGHKVGDKVEQAYDRATAFRLRRDLMAKWAKFVGAR